MPLSPCPPSLAGFLFALPFGACYTLFMEKDVAKETQSHLGHRERLRERFLSVGISGFAPHEALELLLTYAIPRQDVKPLAHLLIQHFGGLNGVLEARAEELTAVPGIGASSAVLISLVLPLFRLYQRNQQEDAQAPVDTSSLIARCQALMMGERVEHFYVLSIDAKGRFISSHQISSGDEGETAVYPRLIARELLRIGAAACVLAHNHPSGDPMPSRADIQLTGALKDILLPLSITLKDHIIISGAKAFSFKSQGLID